ncbi:MAG: M14 family zinc carboxypeptidase, partial [Planctomycetota bacterium]
MLHQRLIFSAVSLVIVVAGCSNCTTRPPPNVSPEVLSMERKLGDTKQSTSSAQRRLPESSIPVDTLIVDADFPGGNVIVDHIEGNTIFLRPDQRNSSEWWFYWYFRVRGAAGCTLKFQFIGKNPIGTQGPAFSTDGGQTWSWLGPRTVQDSSFTYRFDQQRQEVHFCFSIPYLEATLQEFLGKYADNPHFAIHELCRTCKSRSVERLHAGKIDANPKYRVLLTARHHACEMIASYTLEGLLETVLSDTDLGRWFQNNVELLAIPFVDKDGVEAGDQGKNRKPHDHNRDYARKSIYPSVQAIRHFVPEWSQGKLRAAIDLHCPH